MFVWTVASALTKAQHVTNSIVLHHLSLVCCFVSVDVQMCLRLKLFFSLEWSREPCSLGYCHQETAKFCNYGICIEMEMYHDVNLSL